MSDTKRARDLTAGDCILYRGATLVIGNVTINRMGVKFRAFDHNAMTDVERSMPKDTILEMGVMPE